MESGPGSPRILKLGERFEMIFYYKCLDDMDRRYALWARLTNGADTIPLHHILIDDSEYPTTDWTPGEIIKDIRVYEVPEHILPGQYTFEVGLYDLSVGRRVYQLHEFEGVEIVEPLAGAVRRIEANTPAGNPSERLNEYADVIEHSDRIPSAVSRPLLSDAVEVFEKYTKLNPGRLDALCLLGLGYAKLGRFNRAKELFRQLLSEEPNHHEARIALGEILVEENDFSAAAVQLEKIPLSRPEYLHALLTLQDIYARQGPKIKYRNLKKKLRLTALSRLNHLEWDVRGMMPAQTVVHWPDTNIYKEIFLYGDPIRIVFQLKGEESGDRFPYVSIWIDNVRYHAGPMKNESWNDYEIRLPDMEPGYHILKIKKNGGGSLWLGEVCAEYII